VEVSKHHPVHFLMCVSYFHVLFDVVLVWATRHWLCPAGAAILQQLVKPLSQIFWTRRYHFKS